MTEHNKYTDESSRSSKTAEPEPMFTVFLLLLPMAALMAVTGYFVINQGQNWPMCFIPPVFTFCFCVYGIVHPRHRTAAALALIVFEALISYLLYYLSNEYADSFDSMSLHFGTALLGSIFLSVGLCLGILPTILGIKKKRICRKKIQAVCVDIDNHEQSYRSNGKSYTKLTYSSVYQYVYNGITYTKASQYSTDKVKHPINSVRNIFIDPDDPEHILEPKENIGVMVMLLFVGLAFTAGGLAFFITTLDPNMDARPS